MAQRRMFSLSVTDTDVFLDMPVSTQALYFHLGMHGDDDGFVGSPKKIMRAAGCGNDDMKLLAAKGFIIPFDSGVVVLRDWRLNNTLKNDRYHETLYQSEKALVSVDSVGRYQLGTKREPTVFQFPDDAEPEQNLAKLSKTEQSKENTAGKPPAHAHGQFGWVKLTDEQYTRLVHELGQAEVDRCIQYVDESAQATGNKNRWKDWNLVLRRCSRDGWGRRDAQSGSDIRSPARYTYTEEETL